MKNSTLYIAIMLGFGILPLQGLADTVTKPDEGDVKALPEVAVIEKRIQENALGGNLIEQGVIQSQNTNTSDTAHLLESLPGVSSYGAGGISSLPVIHGLADDRIRTLVDGMDLMSACPNHMNPALSYIDPSKVSLIEVYAGIAPVSLGGDSIGGTIQVKSAKPKFAEGDKALEASGSIGIFYRSNGAAKGSNLSLRVAGRDLSATYTDSYSESHNYVAADVFKKDGIWQSLGEKPISGKTVAGSEYKGSRNREFSLAWRLLDAHLVQLKIAEQAQDYQGFPNQRMDMVSSRPDTADPTQYVLDKNKPANLNRTTNLQYTGQFDWGELEARYFHQSTEHRMDMLQHRFFGMYMPMSSEAQTNGGQVKANVDVIEGHQLRLGTDFQYYRLDDWWPPIGVPGSSMCCSDFYNIRDGRRDRLGIFGEWEARWSREWTSLFGIRTDKVISDVGNAQGYNTGWRFVGGQWVERGNAGLYYADAAAFNAKDLKREDRHFDFTTLSRYEPTAQQTYELGLARKTRSPNLYERYPWSTNAMAALMNNFVGDGNGYIGNPDLKPEIAHTLSATADWHDVTKDQWQLRATTYVTYVDNYIDARRLNKLGSAGAGCDGTNVTTTNCYVLLQYSNVDAILYGLDLSGKYRIGSIDGIGSFAVSGLASYVRGENKTTGDPLYHIMPENAKLILEHRLGTWTNSLEVQTVDAKTRVSQVRNEAKTPDYTLYHLRSSLEWKQARLDLTVENLFNEFYYLPLGGAYVAQGNAMTTNAIPWGMVVPGRGRSINVGVTYRF